MKFLYQADDDLRKAIVRGAVRRELRMNFRSAQAVRLDGVPDPEALAVPADEGRILVSHDFQTMPKYFRQFTQGRRSPRVLLVTPLLLSAFWIGEPLLAQLPFYT